MNKILSRWRSITIGLLLIAYMVLVVFMHYPVKTFLYVALGWLLILVLTFLGTFIGALGVIIQLITRKNDIIYPFYKTAYRLGTRNPTILASYGLLMLRRKLSEDAIACFDRALDGTNHFLSTKTLLCNKAIAMWQLGHLDEAIHLYNEALRRFGKDDQKYLVNPSYDDDAIDTLVSENPYFYPTDYTTLGYFYILNGDMVMGSFFSKAAIKSDVNYAAAYDNLGQIAFEAKDYEEADHYFEKSLALNPNQADSLYFSGKLALVTGDPKKAKERFTKASNCHLDGLNAITYEMIESSLSKLVEV